MYGCFLVSGAEVVQFLSIKTSIHTMHFLFVFKLLFEKRGGEIFGDHYFPFGDQEFILDRQLVPVLKKLILNPGILQCYLPVLLIKANVWFRFACWWPLRVTMRASCSICHTQTFFWKNKCVSLLSDYNVYLVSSPRISFRYHVITMILIITMEPKNQKVFQWHFQTKKSKYRNIVFSHSHS